MSDNREATDTVAAMAIEGTHAHAARVDLGTVRRESAVWDHWVLTRDGRTVGRYTVRPATDVVGSQGVLLRGFGPWYGSETPIAAFAIALPTRDVATAREVARHLVRNVVNGNLPALPVSTEDQVTWWAAVGTAMAFIERFGMLDDAIHESTTYGHDPRGCVAGL